MCGPSLVLQRITASGYPRLAGPAGAVLGRVARGSARREIRRSSHGGGSSAHRRARVAPTASVAEHRIPVWRCTAARNFLRSVWHSIATVRTRLRPGPWCRRPTAEDRRERDLGLLAHGSRQTRPRSPPCPRPSRPVRPPSRRVSRASVDAGARTGAASGRCSGRWRWPACSTHGRSGRTATRTSTTRRA